MIILWNTRYLNRAIASMREIENVPNHLLAHLSPLGWEHVNLTGDYIWVPADQLAENHDGFRPLRRAPDASPGRVGFPICPLMRIRGAFR
jgi:hypothetical protein